jgi:geranylgeranyl diphosphate synthase type II
MTLSITQAQNWIEEDLQNFYQSYPSTPLFEPIQYLLRIGGKRMRPALVLLSHQLFSDTPENAREAALAIEVFHNFTLMHDDIMDKAPLRRGHNTVHERYNTNTAILSGDAMMIQAYQLLMKRPCKNQHALIELFNQKALEVCIGQELDMSFESRNDVSVEEYLEMIRLKTAVLVGGALQMGAIIADASPENQSHLYACGEEMGLAFQLMDDYLDAFGNPETVGKQTGGDILADKKTYLYLQLLSRASQDEKRKLQSPFSTPEEKVGTIKEWMRHYSIDAEIKALADQYSQSAIEHLNTVDCHNEKKQPLIQVVQQLLHRQA